MGCFFVGGTQAPALFFRWRRGSRPTPPSPIACRSKATPPEQSARQISSSLYSLWSDSNCLGKKQKKRDEKRNGQATRGDHDERDMGDSVFAPVDGRGCIVALRVAEASRTVHRQAYRITGPIGPKERPSYPFPFALLRATSVCLVEIKKTGREKRRSDRERRHDPRAVMRATEKRPPPRQGKPRAPP